MLTVWEERKVRLYGEHANVHQSHSQNDSGDLRGVAGGDGELGCLCGKAGTSHLCDGSAHSSGCMVNGQFSVPNFRSDFYLSIPHRHGIMNIQISELPHSVFYGSVELLMKCSSIPSSDPIVSDSQSLGYRFRSQGLGT